MPLFHSNAVVAGWAVGVAGGAAMAPARFSASRFLDDVRRYGATYMNYVGKPLAYVLATAEQPDDADNPLRVAFGNEASDRDIDEFARRFGCMVWDGFGSTENAVIITREDGTPPGSIGKGFEGVADLRPRDGDRVRRPRVFDEHGSAANADEAVGELVNTQGAGYFSGYYNDQEANDDRMRHGMYWSGDLAYRDADGWIYLAGRTADWMRVDGENLAAAPIERILLRLRADQPGGGVRRPGRARRRPGDGRARAQRRRDADARGAGGVPRPAGRPAAEGLAPLRPARPDLPTPPPTRCSSASWSPRAPPPATACCALGRARHGVARPDLAVTAALAAELSSARSARRCEPAPARVRNRTWCATAGSNQACRPRRRSGRTGSGAPRRGRRRRPWPAACGGALRSKSAICTSTGPAMPPAHLRGAEAAELEPDARRRPRCARWARRCEVVLVAAARGVSAPTSPGAADDRHRHAPGRPGGARRARSRARSSEISRGWWLASACRPAARPSTSGVSDTTAATSSRTVRRGLSTWPPASETPQSTSRYGSTPGSARPPSSPRW